MTNLAAGDTSVGSTPNAWTSAMFGDLTWSAIQCRPLLSKVLVPLTHGGFVFHVNHGCGFRSNSITDSGASRSLIPIQPDH